MIRGHFLISASDLIGRANSNRSSVKLLLAAAVLTSTAFGLWLGYPTPRTEHSARMRGGDPPEFSVEKAQPTQPVGGLMGRRCGSMPSAGLGYRVEERLGPSLLCPVSRSKKLKSCDTIRRHALPLRGEQSVEIRTALRRMKMITLHTSVTDTAPFEGVEPGLSKSLRIPEGKLEIPVTRARLRHPEPDGPPDRTPIRVGEVWENPVTGERATILSFPGKTRLAAQPPS